MKEYYVSFDYRETYHVHARDRHAAVRIAKDQIEAGIKPDHVDSLDNDDPLVQELKS